MTYSADDQRDDFWAYINQDSYLKDRKGKYTERGGAIMPWHHQLDFKFNQNFYLKVAGQKNTCSLVLISRTWLTCSTTVGVSTRA